MLLKSEQFQMILVENGQNNVVLFETKRIAFVCKQQIVCSSRIKLGLEPAANVNN